MVAAFIRDRGVTVCPPHQVQHSGPSAAGGETPESFLFRESSAARTPEQKLAAAKILQMLMDLGGVGRAEPHERFKIKEAARSWFFRRSDFGLWCETAGIDPDMVRQKARKIEQEGWPQWRAEAGKGKRFEERRAYRERVKLLGLK